MTDEIQTKVISLIAHELGLWRNAAKVEIEDSFEKLGADSLDCLALTMTFEEDFNIEITDDEAAAIKTVEQAVELVRAKMGVKA